jgi:hypothetical protein
LRLADLGATTTHEEALGDVLLTERFMHAADTSSADIAASPFFRVLRRFDAVCALLRPLSSSRNVRCCS